MSLFTRPGLLAGLYFACLFAALGAHLPYWPLWLEDWGLTTAEVGVYLALGVVVRVPLGLILPALADRWRARRAMLLGLGVTAGVVTLAHLWIGDRTTLLLATAVFAGCVSALIPISDALALGAARRHELEYADIRWPGSAAFLAMSLGLGALIATQGVWVVIWAVVIFMGLSALLGAIHPGGGSATPEGGAGAGETLGLLTQPHMLLFAGAMTMIHASHGVMYSYGSLHWAALGYSEALIGRFWAFSVLVEILLMIFFGARLVRWLGPVGALALAGAAGVLRWSLMAMDPALALLWPLQGLHALTFGAAHLGAMAFLQAATPERLQASAQGAVGAALGGAAMAGAMFAAAALYPAIGGMTYAFSALLAGAGLICAALLARVWDGRAVEDV